MEIIILIIWFVLSVVVASAASQRGRSGFGWFLLSFFLSPLLAAIFLLLFPSLRDPISERAAVGDKELWRAIELATSPTQTPKSFEINKKRTGVMRLVVPLSLALIIIALLGKFFAIF